MIVRLQMFGRTSMTSSWWNIPSSWMGSTLWVDLSLTSTTTDTLTLLQLAQHSKCSSSMSVVAFFEFSVVHEHVSIFLSCRHEAPIPTHFYVILTSCGNSSFSPADCQGPLETTSFTLPHRPDHTETCAVSHTALAGCPTLSYRATWKACWGKVTHQQTKGWLRSSDLG